MSGHGHAGLAAHLAGGTSSVARAWELLRRDGRRLGFTDHDRDLKFEGTVFRAATGLSASALSQSSGLAVDNAEAMGALSDESVNEADILAGRFDAAQVTCWLVNWRDTEMRQVLFSGTLGEIEREGQAFRAELRGLAEVLNQPRGQVYQARCSALLGDARCGFDPASSGYAIELPVERVEDVRRFSFADLRQFEPRWFEHGTLRVLSGSAEGLSGLVRMDRFESGRRVVDLWEEFRAEVLPGDRLRLEAGCDKAAGTCRLKFSNFLNFRGFPHIPGEDWLMRYPTRAGDHNGRSLTGGET